MKFLRHYIFLILNWAERSYWSLSYWPRHIVGVFILIFSLLGIGYGCYGAYCGVSYVVCTAADYVSSIFIKDEAKEDDDPYSNSDEYSRPGHNHFKFKVADSEKHPKRRPNYHKDFAHVNDIHLAAAKRLGVHPLSSRDDLTKYIDKLVELHDTKYYKIDKLTQSVPYMVPKAADFLTDLGRLMQEYNGTHSRFIVTSVLRTQADVKRLRRGNVNASENSTHCYGTTIDITYNRFDIHGKTHEGKLKEDLAKALYDLQEKGYCYVKYEVKQPCFHITVRP